MTLVDDPTTDPGRRSWVPGADTSDFPVQNLPYGVFRRPGRAPRVGVAIGDRVLALAVLAEVGLLGDLAPPEVFRRGDLNALASLGVEVWRPLRRRIADLLTEGNHEIGHAGVREHALVSMAEVELLRPIDPGDLVDFYSSLEHATNLGRMFRPDGEPLLANWRWMPVGYHGRSATVVVSGTPIRRPRGQAMPPGVTRPLFGPTRALDLELEVGFVVGPGNRLGEPIPIEETPERIFGLVLVNDWSARDIQRWEYQPLGPFLGKSFATTISPWVVPFDALAPFRVPAPPQDPPPLDHLRIDGDWGLDIDLEVALQSDEMRRGGLGPATIARTNHRHLYWTIPQQLAHATSNGAVTRPGDLYASGTISGPDPGSYGSLIEITWRGERPLRLPDGTERTFLQDHDRVVLRGVAAHPGGPRIGFGEAEGTVVPA